MDYKNLAKKYGTPLYIYDFDLIKEQYLALKSEFNARKSLICYAIKANSNLSILKFLATLGSGFDCVSFNEVKRALLAGASPYKVIFSGVGKEISEIRDAIKANILMINAESRAELKMIESVAKELNQKARISIRVNPNIDPKTHPYISTGLKENKFGVSIDEAKKMYIMAKNSEFLDPIGIHFHIGSQLFELDPIKESAKIVSNLMSELRALEIDIKFFDIGGGIGIRYKDEKEFDLYSYAQGILASLNGQDTTIVCEPGRFIVGNSGELLAKVLLEKENDGKRFVVVDAGMNDLLRPSLYEAYHEIVAIKDSKSSEKELKISKADIVGPICESGDFLGKDRDLPALDYGDLLVVRGAGAYGMSMASNYNSRLKPAEVALKDGKEFLIRKRESFDDLIKDEIEFLGKEI